jgi:hypothetical protein
MRRLAKALAGALAAALVLGATLAAGPAQAAYGINNFSVAITNEDGSPATQAGSHPFAVTTSFRFNTRVDPELGVIPDQETKELHIQLPAGFVGSRTAVPRCATASFLSVDEEGLPACPDSTAVGVTKTFLSTSNLGETDPVYNLVPPPGEAAKIGFIVNNVPVTVEIGINGEAPNNIVAGLLNVPQVIQVYGASTQLWGDPAAHSHDALRGRCLALGAGPGGEYASRGICPAGAPEAPFITLPRSCTGPLITSFEALSWQEPQAPPLKGSTSSPAMSGCSKLGFSPQVKAKPTTTSAESASGLDFSIDFNDEGLTSPSGLAQSDIKKAVVTMPAGMTLNPSAAEGLTVCSKAGYEAESLASLPGQGCPQASKVGEVEVLTPLAEGEVIRGSVFLASQDDNPFGTLAALYMVIKDPELGLLVKLAGKVQPSEEAGPDAGRLVTTFEEIPQVPFSHFNFHFHEGPRGALVTPPACDADPSTPKLDPYTTEAQFTPWADPAHPLTTNATFDVTSGVGGGPCPAAGIPPFHPGFEAGSRNNAAGAYSPFDMRLTRADGEQEMTRFDAVLPKGVTGKLAGIPQCPEAAVAIAKAKSGRQELANPSCPTASQIGRTLVGAGVGSILTYVPGKLYLGGPFAGDPLSVISITPAVAGPFDVGTVVVHVALTLNPETAEVEVDGAHSDPIPHILKGIPVKARDLRVYADRPNFTLNPTSCAKKEARATLFGSFLNVFDPADDVPVALSDRYQAASCASLKFKPHLALALKGGTKRGAHPALKATLTYPPGAGYANIAKAVVTLPHSAFLEQSHIRTVCTRVQFAAHQCPAGSIYGKAKAVTPLLDEPLEGPVYLRSSSHPLPDLVIALHGLVDFNLVGRIDSVNARIRTSFESAPDAPVSKFSLEMQGAKKGLIVNSRNLCAAPAKAIAAFTAQSGRGYEQKPVVRATGCRAAGKH